MHAGRCKAAVNMDRTLFTRPVNPKWTTISGHHLMTFKVVFY